MFHNIYDMSDVIGKHLREMYGEYSSLLQLWNFSFIDGNVLVLPAEVATEIAEAHPEGYHHGLWHLATEYEALLAKALLTNSKGCAAVYQQPKTFSAWPRQHNVIMYRKASAFRGKLSGGVMNISATDRSTYEDLIRRWHQSVTYISRISGDTRLDQDELNQLCLGLFCT